MHDPFDPSRTTGYTYNANGSLETMTAPNAVVHTYGYDPLNRLRTLTIAKGPASLHAYEYKLRASGHRRQIVEGVKTTTFSYDGVYRLNDETVAADANGNDGSIGYTLDKVGNRLARNSQLSALNSQLNQSFNSRDWLNGDAYTANGSTQVGRTVLGEPPATDIYDFEEHLILRTKPDGTTINVNYDADGHRVAKNILNASAAPVSSTSWLVDTNNLTGYAQVLEERSQITNPASQIRKVYTYGSALISQATSLNSQPSTLSYYTSDGHGNVRELTDASGTVTDRYDYDAFGLLVFQSGTTANAYRYCGEQIDGDLGLYYLRARYLNPDSGRFWSMDSYEGSRSDPMSLHKYLYAHADPVRFSDPTGHFSMAEIQHVMFVTGTLARIAAPSVARFGITVAQRLAADALKPIFGYVGGLGLTLSKGQPLTMLDRWQRFFMTATKSYPQVGDGWFGALLKKIPGVQWNQHHVFIQQAWYRAGGPNQWYPGDELANIGMQRLGNAGFNLMAIPAGLNRAMGAATTAGAAQTAAFATATAGSIGLAIERIAEMIENSLDDEQPSHNPNP